MSPIIRSDCLKHIAPLSHRIDATLKRLKICSIDYASILHSKHIDKHSYSFLMILSHVKVFLLSRSHRKIENFGQSYGFQTFFHILCLFLGSHLDPNWWDSQLGNFHLLPTPISRCLTLFCT
jgi:hypothetical protein